MKNDDVEVDDGYEFKYVGELQVGDESRNFGKVVKIEIGSMTNTIHFERESIGMKIIRTWHQFHSVEVKKKGS